MTVKDFGITKDGIATKLYTLKNNNLIMFKIANCDLKDYIYFSW